MKLIASGLLVLGLLAVQISEANAVTCDRGSIGRAASVRTERSPTHRGYGYHGAAVVRPAAVVRHGAHCYYRAGVRVCR